jgi:MSHA biogenesis protein MshJ
MKQYWIKLSTRLDAMTLRERFMVFGAAVAAVLFVLYSLAIEPLLARQKMLLAQISQQDNQIAGIDMEISAKAAAYVIDPDADTRARLKAAQDKVAASTEALMTMQKGLVAPNKIAPLLEHLLRGNGKLKLMSLRSLPVTGLSEAAVADAPKPAAAPVAVTPAAPGPAAAVVAAATPAPVAGAVPPVTTAPPKPRELLYRHGVEIVLQGSYLDMVNYMDALEALPTQLFWGKAKLDAGQYPDSRLTLTLYTLSLDQKWMKL